MVRSAEMRRHCTELGVLDTTRISGSSCSLTVIGLTDNFLIHDATDLRWNERARISGEIGSNQYGQMSQRDDRGTVFPLSFLRPSREGCLVSGEISPCSTVGDLVSQNGGERIMNKPVCQVCGRPLKGRQVKYCSDKCRVLKFHRGRNAAKEKTKHSCPHSKVHIVETTFWNGSEYKTQYHCSRCGRILKKEQTRLRNTGTVKIQYIEQEDKR